jgi:DNA-binding HxlR family transcriptional regulator
MLGDRWSLLIIRDMMLLGYTTFKQFLGSYEHIASNILADRLKRLEHYGIIVCRPDPADRRKQLYSLTRKGLDLAPVLTEMVLWAAAHEDTGNQPLIKLMRKDKQKLIAQIRRRHSAITPK